MQFFPQKAQTILQQVIKNVYICKCVAAVRNLIFTHIIYIEICLYLELSLLLFFLPLQL